MNKRDVQFLIELIQGFEAHIYKSKIFFQGLLKPKRGLHETNLRFKTPP
jgi:hypothetical protein